jgi:hypothetical protein
MVVWMVADRTEIEITVSAISSDVIAGTVTVTEMIGGNADAATAIAIGTADVGAAGNRLSTSEGSRQEQ